MLGREACVYVRASSAMLGRAGLMVRQVGPARNRCACASLSRAASHTSGAYPFVHESSCGSCRGRAVRTGFARKLYEDVGRIPVFTCPHDFREFKTWNQGRGSVQFDGAPSVPVDRAQDRAVHYSPCGRWYVLDVITSAAAARNFARSCNTQERLAGVPPSWSAAAAVSQASRTTSRDLRVSSHE